MSIPTDRLPAWTIAAPVLALGADLALRGGTGLGVGLALAAALLAAVLAAVHHAELLAQDGYYARLHRLQFHDAGESPAAS